MLLFSIISYIIKLIFKIFSNENIPIKVGGMRASRVHLNNAIIALSKNANDK